MKGEKFQKNKEALVVEQIERKKNWKGNRPNAARILTDEEVDFLQG